MFYKQACELLKTSEDVSQQIKLQVRQHSKSIYLPFFPPQRVLHISFCRSVSRNCKNNKSFSGPYGIINQCAHYQWCSRCDIKNVILDKIMEKKKKNNKLDCAFLNSLALQGHVWKKCVFLMCVCSSLWEGFCI